MLSREELEKRLTETINMLEKVSFSHGDVPAEEVDAWVEKCRADLKDPVLCTFDDCTLDPEAGSVYCTGHREQEEWKDGP